MSEQEKLREMALALRDEQYLRDLQKSGSAIGYGRSQQILGELWDAMLHAEYGATSSRGGLGVTIDDDLPPLPKATKLRREMQSYGGYRMVPAYTVDEMKKFGHAAINKASAWQPIETAPKDGAEILSARLEDEDYRIVHWLEVFEGGWVDMEYRRFDPTHWAPLPEAPK